MNCLFSRVRMTNAILLEIISQASGMFSKQNHMRDFYTATAVGADTWGHWFHRCLSLMGLRTLLLCLKNNPSRDQRCQQLYKPLRRAEQSTCSALAFIATQVSAAASTYVVINTYKPQIQIQLANYSLCERWGKSCCFLPHTSALKMDVGPCLIRVTCREQEEEKASLLFLSPSSNPDSY